MRKLKKFIDNSSIGLIVLAIGFLLGNVLGFLGAILLN